MLHEVVPCGFFTSRKIFSPLNLKRRQGWRQETLTDPKAVPNRQALLVVLSYIRRIDVAACPASGRLMWRPTRRLAAEEFAYGAFFCAA